MQQLYSPSFIYLTQSNLRQICVYEPVKWQSQSTFSHLYSSEWCVQLDLNWMRKNISATAN